MNLELEDSFVSEANPDLNIKVTVNCEKITIEDTENREFRKSITLTIKELEKALCIYDAFLAAKEAIGYDLEKVRHGGSNE